MEPETAATIAGTNGNLLTFEDPGGAFRAHYRNKYTAADEFSRNFTVEMVDGEAVVPADKFARWCLERFVAAIEIKGTDGKWTRHRFTWDVVDGAADVALGAFLVSVAYVIATTVVDRSAQNLDALKKTSLTSSGNSISADTPPASPGSIT